MHNQDNKEEFLKRFGSNFGKIRKKKKLSFRTLSQKCDLDYADLNKIEKGKRNITLFTKSQPSLSMSIFKKNNLLFKS